MLVDLYCPFYNEKINVERVCKYWKLLPLRNIVLYDNSTTDNSINYIKDNFKNVFIIENDDPGINDLNYLYFKNEMWKQSRGKVDFVIVCDFDEVIWSNNIIKSLEDIKNNGGTIANMASFSLMCEDQYLTNNDNFIHLQNNVKFKHHEQGMNKRILFDPNQIQSIKFGAGAHSCNPIGNVKYFDSDIYFFHLSDLGLTNIINKYQRNALRLSELNKKYGLGLHYCTDPKQIAKNFYEQLTNTITWKEISQKNNSEFYLK